MSPCGLGEPYGFLWDSTLNLPLHEDFLEAGVDADLLIGFSTELVGGQKDASIIEPHNLKFRDFDPCDTTSAVGREGDAAALQRPGSCRLAVDPEASMSFSGKGAVAVEG